MFISSRIARTLATTFVGAALVLCTGVAGGVAQAQISGSIGGDFAGRQLIEDEGIFFEGPRGVQLSADVTTTDAAGGPRTARIIAILIGQFAPRSPGLSDYALDTCRQSDGGAPTDAGWRGCRLVARRFRAFMEGRATWHSRRADHVGCGSSGHGARGSPVRP